MAFVITKECTNCGACQDVCPIHAISEGFDRREINADDCVSCGTCFIVCEAKAIQPEERAEDEAAFSSCCS